MFFIKKQRVILGSLMSIVLTLLFINPILAQSLEAPVGGDLNAIIGKAIHLVLGLVGILALVMFIYGGVVWITSGGNAEQVKKGKGSLIWATIGLVMVFMAYSLVYFLMDKALISGSGGGGETGTDDACVVEAGGRCMGTDGPPVVTCLSLCRHACTLNKCSSRPSDNNYNCCEPE